MRQSNIHHIFVVGVATLVATLGCKRTESAVAVARSASVTLPSASVVAESAHTRAQPTASVRAPAPSASAAKSDVAAGTLGADCYAGFVPSAVPHVDVLALGLICGPSTGLSLLTRISATVDESGPPAVMQWEAERGDCFRLFAVAKSPVDDLEVEILRVHGARVSLTNQSRRWVVVDEAAPFCAESPGTLEARFSTHSGHGEMSAAVWKGSDMAPKQKK